MELGSASPSTARPPLPAAGADLQFDSAEFSEEAKPSLQCVACKHAISETYYAAGDKILCAACRETLAQPEVERSGTGRFLRALLLGVPAALLGTLIYYGIAALTGYEFGLVAIVIGVLVGRAVRYGSRGRGGWVYQSLAVLLTYFSITATYVPYIIEGMVHDGEKGEVAGTTEGAAENDATALVNDEEEDAAVPVAAAQPAVATSAAASADEPFPVGAVLLAVVALFGIAMIAPFFAGPMGLVIIGIGLYEAWKINRRVEVAISGPHRVAAAG